MDVGYSGHCGSLLVFTGQVEGSEGCVCVCLMSELGVATLWVCLLWSVFASDVVIVWVWVTVGVAAPCWCLLARWKALRGVCV